MMYRSIRAACPQFTYDSKSLTTHACGQASSALVRYVRIPYDGDQAGTAVSGNFRIYICILATMHACVRIVRTLFGKHAHLVY